MVIGHYCGQIIKYEWEKTNSLKYGCQIFGFLVQELTRGLLAKKINVFAQ